MRDEEKKRAAKRRSYHKLKNTRTPEYKARQVAQKEAYRARKRAENIEEFRERANAASKSSRTNKLIEKAGRPPGDTCEICGGPPGGRGRMHFDHDHEKDAFRGWLCHHCNLALGHVKDNIDVLRKMIDYLSKAVA